MKKILILALLVGCTTPVATSPDATPCPDASYTDAPDSYVTWRDVFASYARGACSWAARCDPYDFFYTYLDVDTCVRESTDDACLEIGGNIPCWDGFSGSPRLLVDCQTDLDGEVCTAGTEAEPDSCAVMLATLRGD